MKKILIFVFVLFHISISFSQTYSVTVIDAASGKNLEFVNIAILDATNKSILQGGITSENGKARIDKIPLDKSVVAKISFIGYETHTSEPFTLTAERPNRRGGTILLKASSQSLEAVEVEGEKRMIEYKLDKKIVNVSQSLVSQGGTAVDVLENVPTVTVDEDGNVSMKGSSGVTLLIDGRPAVLSGLGLDQIPAASIENIELISNPSAKYNPEGMSGIINIKLKQSSRKVGVNGTVNASAATNNSYNLSTNLNFGVTKDVSIIASLGGNFRQRKGSGRSDTYNEIDTLGNMSWEHGESSSVNSGFGGNAKLGVDWKINSKNSILVSVGGGIWNMQRKNTSPDGTRYSKFFNDNGTYYNPRYPDMNVQDTWQYTSINNSYGNNMFNQINGVVSYKWDGSKKDEELTFDASFDYSIPNSYSESERTRQTPSDTNLYKQESRIKGSGIDFDGQINYVYPINEKMKIEVGAQSKVRTNASYQRQNIPSDISHLQDSALDFTYMEQNHGVYFNYMATFGNFSMQLGVRGEVAAMQAFTKTESQDTSFDYFRPNFYPAVHLSYKISKMQEIQLSYSRRVNRPRPWDLNPFTDYGDYPVSIHYGNPNLRPEDVHSLELNYSLFFKKAGSIFATVYYRRTEDVIRRYIFDDLDGLKHNTNINYASSTNYGFDLSYDVTLLRIWRLSLSGGFYRNLVQGGGEAYLNSEGYSYNVRWNNTLTLPLDFTVQLSASYRGPMYFGQTVIDAQFNSDIAIRKSFLKRKIVVGLRLSDIANTRQFNRFVVGNNFESYNIRKMNSRALFLTFTYNINQGYREKQRKRSNQIEGTADTSDGGGEM
ncbi:MAG: TonB-dependent receptor [Bacteroidales bacterium]|jgi:outer membrane receptor protein involved in Fe transport|nr:TonB-dependent receptor [Bacteroidales bacterium]